MNVISGLISLSSPLTLLPLILVLFLTQPYKVFENFLQPKSIPGTFVLFLSKTLESIVLLRNFSSFKCRMTSRRLTLELEIPTIGMILFAGHLKGQGQYLEDTL